MILQNKRALRKFRIALLLWLLTGPATLAAEAPTGLFEDVVFTHYTNLTGSTEFGRRWLTPLVAFRLKQALAAKPQAILEQPIDLGQEKFTVYVPPEMPPKGYALMVFVPPWQEGVIPRLWQKVFERHGMIFVSAAHSGNDLSTQERRAPLALLAAHNVMALYRVDPDQVYVGGFSGGSKVALRVAIRYPDLFRGALLEAGSEAIDDSNPPPPTELFHRFQESMRLVFLTGAADKVNLETDQATRVSLKDWCVFDIETLTMRLTGHEKAPPAQLDQALDALIKRDPPDPARLAECRSRLDQDLAAQLAQVKASIAAGKRDQAQEQLVRIDAHFGGLAAPASIELAERLDLLH